MTPLTRLRLRVEIALARYGRVLMAGSLGAAVVLIGAIALTQQHAQVRDLQAHLGTLHRADPMSVEPAQPTSDTQRLMQFEQLLGHRRELDVHLGTLFASARQRGLRLMQGEYRLTSVPQGHYQRYEIVLPVEGRFDAIQDFTRQVLLALPFAALEGIAVQRESVQHPVVEAKLRFALYLRTDPENPPGQTTTSARAS